MLANDLGGFAPDGREYVLAVGGDGRTPAPWSNVLANPTFGCLVTEAGPRCTWVDNSQSRRLTSWANDPVTDPATEAIFLHDRATDRAWSLTPSPRPSGARYVVRHAQGRTTWEHATDEWHSVLSVSVPAGRAGQAGAPAPAQRRREVHGRPRSRGTPS